MAGMANDCLEISAPSHVHVGNIDIHGGLGRLYGTLGFTLEKPRLRVKICRSSKNEVRGTSRRDVEEYVDLFSKYYGVELSVSFMEEIPAHVGLGSTTPIALSIGIAAAILSGKRYDLEDIALRAKRSRVTGLGFYSFKYGGFICDGGYRPDKLKVPPLLMRVPVPEKYRIIYAVPTKHLDEIFALKEREDEILESMPAMDERMAEKNARIVLMGILPAVAEGDWETAGRLLYRLNRGLGEYWASEQRGIYCCEEVEEIVNFYLQQGALCACQSSWGPTVYALFPAGKVDSVYGKLVDLIEELGGGLHGVTKVDNNGAMIRAISDG